MLEGVNLANLMKGWLFSKFWRTKWMQVVIHTCVCGLWVLKHQHYICQSNFFVHLPNFFSLQFYLLYGTCNLFTRFACKCTLYNECRSMMWVLVNVFACPYCSVVGGIVQSFQYSSSPTCDSVLGRWTAHHNSSTGAHNGVSVCKLLYVKITYTLDI